MADRDPTKQKNSILAIIILLILIFVTSKKVGWVYAAFAVALMSLLSTGFTALLHRAWSVVTELLARLNAVVILGIVFIFVLMPTALVRSVFGKKNSFSKDRNRLSTFQERDHLFEKNDFQNPW